MYGQFFVIFAMIFTGFILRKLNFIREEMNNSLNKFIVYCAYPCLLAYNIGIMDMTIDFLVDFILMLCVSEAILLGYAAFGRLYGKLRNFPVRVSNVIELSMTCPNNGFMGFPMGLAILGSQGLFLMTAQNSAMNIFFFTYALYALRRNNKDKNKLTLKSAASSVVKVILNPNIVALFVGLALSFLHISLDNPIGVYLDYIGGAATPMAMIFIGSTLASSNFLEMIRNRIVWEATIGKLIIMPVITALIMLLVPLSHEMKIIMVLGVCFPTAATVPMLAEQEKQNHELASKILFFSTVLSMATVPITITLIEALF